MKYCFIVFLFLFSILPINACESVCSISNLKQIEEQKEDIIIQILKNLFEKELNEDAFFSELTTENEYNDLFIYKYSISVL